MIKYRFVTSKFPSELKKNFLRKEVQEMLENEIGIENEFEDAPTDMNQLYRVLPSMYTEDVVAVFESPVDGKWHFYLEEEF